MFERILLPLDGSELAEIAIPYAEELASGLGSEVVLYHVRRHEHADQQRMHQMYLDRLAEVMELNIERGQKEKAPVKISAQVEGGEPAENICNFVVKNKIDLLVIG